VALDKDRTLALAARLGVPAPKTFLVERVDQITASLDQVEPPVVLKPMRSIGESDVDRKQLRVDYAFNERQLTAKLEGFLRYGSVLLQEYVGGDGVGIEVIADHGELVYAFQHARVHEVPLTGGGSSLRVSEAVNPELLEAARKLLAELKWHGVAMVEFKLNRKDGSFSLMEINGRFWGSLPLAVAAGADFPKMLFELMTAGHISPPPPAKSGVYCRKLSSDMHWLELVLRRDGPRELVSFPSNLAVLKDWLRIFGPRHHFDVQQWTDPRPGFVDISRIGLQYLKRLNGVRLERAELRSQHRAWRSGGVAQRMKTAGSLLFICYGNINRSAVAERVWLNLLPHDGPHVVSAGFHSQQGRAADPTMVEVAAAAGIDMRNWSSHRVTPQMVEDSDIIFGMELVHVERMAEEFPASRGKTFLLGMASAESPTTGEIADPYGKDVAEYTACLAQIRKNLGVLAAPLLADNRH
jgi:protein-tyrosine-phosphatase